MTEVDNYLYRILQNYTPEDLSLYSVEINQLKNILTTWASTCYLDILESGSRAKGTAISIASDLDYLVSLTSNCNDNNGGLRACYDTLFTVLNSYYPNARRQNVSVRIKIRDLDIDITPARKYTGNNNYHNLYVSKTGSWTLTNIQRHINDISQSGRINEIKILKIWRELHQLDFPSIYLEYLLLKVILLNRSTSFDSLGDNVWYALNELAKTQNNPLFSRIVDPSNTNNILSDLLTNVEKDRIINQAQISISQSIWENIVW